MAAHLGATSVTRMALLMMLLVAPAMAGVASGKAAPRRSLLQDFISHPGFVIPTAATPTAPTEYIPTPDPTVLVITPTPPPGQGDDTTPTVPVWTHPNLMPTMPGDQGVSTVVIVPTAPTAPTLVGAPTPAPAPTMPAPTQPLDQGINSLIGNLMTWTKAPTPIPPWRTAQPTAAGADAAAAVLGEGSWHGKMVSGAVALASMVGVAMVVTQRRRAAELREAEGGEGTHLLKVVGASVMHTNYNTAADVDNL